MDPKHGKFLGEEVLKTLAGTPYESYGPTDWAMYFVSAYGQIDGDHHKTWVLDQVARVLKGTPVKVCLARWADGHTEYRISTADETSAEYKAWVEEMLGEEDEDGEREYGYDEGIPP